jgi:hypothetical protein
VVLPNKEKFGETSAAIVIEVTRSETVAVPGQPVDEEPVVTGSAGAAKSRGLAANARQVSLRGAGLLVSVRKPRSSPLDLETHRRHRLPVMIHTYE